MHIANILEESVFGGPHRRVVLVAEELQKIGVTTTAVHARNADRYVTECTSRSIRSVAVEVSTLSRSWRDLAAYVASTPRDLRSIRRALQSQDFAMVHCSGGAWAFKSVLGAKLSGLPFVWHMNDTYQPDPVLRALRVLVKVLKPAGVVFSSVATREYYQRFFPIDMPSTVVYPPVDRQLSALDAATVERPATFAANCFNVVLVSNVNPTKRILESVEAFARLRARGLRVALTVAGAVKSSQKEYFARCCAAAGNELDKSVHFVGQVEDPSVYFAHADLALCTSISEAGPMTMFEAAAVGCPILTTDVGDLRLLLGGYPSVTFAQMQHLEEEILAAASSPPRRLSAGERQEFASVVGAASAAAATHCAYTAAMRSRELEC